MVRAGGSDRATRDALLRDPEEVVLALRRLFDRAAPRTGSLMFVGGGASHAARDPFGPGFIEHIDERAELVRRLRRLSPRDRLLLLLWYVERWPVNEIAEHLCVSRVHCYRIRNRAIAELAAPADDPAA